MQRLSILSRRLKSLINVTQCSISNQHQTNITLANPCVAMSPDGSHIVCYHPEKLHPYEFTKPIDRNDPSMAQNDSIFNMQVQTDYNNRYYKKKLTKKDFRLETEKLAKMFNEHYATFRLTPRKDKIKNCSQFPTPPPDRAGI